MHPILGCHYETELIIFSHLLSSFHIKLLSKAVKKTKYWLLKHVLTPLPQVWQIIDLPASTSPFQLLDFWMQIPGRRCSFWKGRLRWVCSKINLTNHTNWEWFAAHKLRLARVLGKQLLSPAEAATLKLTPPTLETPNSGCSMGMELNASSVWLETLSKYFKIVGHKLWVCLSILNIFRLNFPLFNMSISLDNHLRAIFVTSSFESAFPAQFRGVLSRLPDAWTSLPPPFVPVKTGLRCCKLSNSCAN